MAPRKIWIGPPNLRRALVPIDSLHHLERNARVGRVDVVRESLRENGQYKQIIVREQTREVLVGNHTLEGAREEGWTHIAVLWRDEPDDDRARRIATVDNRSSDLAEWDPQLLAAELGDLRQIEERGLAGTGFSEADLDQVLRNATKAASAAANPGELEDPEVGAPPAEPITKPGDVWRLGRHRLICGDSTDPETARKASGRGLDLIFTSPPYNVGVKYYGQRTDDKLDGWKPYGKFLRSVVEAWLPHLRPGRALAWNIGVAPATFPAHQHLMLEDAGLTFFRQVVWDKQMPAVPLWHNVERDPRARNWPIEYRHEIVLVMVNGKELERGDRLPHLDPIARTSVMQITAVQARRDLPDGGGHGSGSAGKGLNHNYDKPHPAVFPVKLVQPFMTHLTAPGETVCDPFGGAATTVLAAEQLDRTGIAVEIDPGFCDVAIERFENLTGQKAKRDRARATRAPGRSKAA